MEEGTFPPNPGDALPKPQNSWETPQQQVVNQNFSGDIPVAEASQVPPNPSSVVYRPSETQSEGDGSGSRHSFKKILKLLIGFFVIFSIILSVLAFFVLPKSDKESDEEVILTYWGLFEDESVVRPVIAEFEKENPNIKIKYEKQDLDEYKDKLTVRTQNGNGPDVFRYHPTWFPMISNILMPLPSEVIDRSKFDQNYYEFMKDDLIKNGAIYGIPLYTDTLALFVNTSLFQQASQDGGSEVIVPKTWQEFIDSSARLTKRDTEGRIEVAGAGIGTFDNVTHAPDILSLLFAQNGVDLKNPGASQEKIADALRFYTNFSQVEDNVWDSTQDFTQLAFTQGKLAMYFGYYWDLVTFKASNPSLQFKVVPVPQLVTDEKVNVASYWAEGASSATKHPKEVLLFMEFLARPETQEKLYLEQAKVRQLGEPYSLKIFAEKLKDADSFTFIDQSNTAVSTPFVGAAFDKGLNERLNNIIKDSINSILEGGSEVDSSQKIIDGYFQAVSEFSGAPAK